MPIDQLDISETKRVNRVLVAQVHAMKILNAVFFLTRTHDEPGDPLCYRGFKDGKPIRIDIDRAYPSGYETPGVRENPEVAAYEEVEVRIYPEEPDGRLASRVPTHHVSVRHQPTYLAYEVAPGETTKRRYGWDYLTPNRIVNHPDSELRGLPNELLEIAETLELMQKGTDFKQYRWDIRARAWVTVSG